MRARRKIGLTDEIDDLVDYTLKQMYDIKCFELATQFLEDHFDPVPLDKARELAQEIQDAIEEWLSSESK